MRILVVEDDAALRERIVRTLGRLVELQGADELGRAAERFAEAFDGIYPWGVAIFVDYLPGRGPRSRPCPRPAQKIGGPSRCDHKAAVASARIRGAPPGR